MDGARAPSATPVTIASAWPSQSNLCIGAPSKWGAVRLLYMPSSCSHRRWLIARFRSSAQALYFFARARSPCSLASEAASVSAL